MDLHHRHVYLNTFFVLLAFAATANALVLDIWIMRMKIPLTRVVEKEIAAPPALIESDYQCPASCTQQIKEATASFQITTKQQTISSNLPSSKIASVKEFFVPLGSGLGTADEWTDVPGAQAYVDTTSYGSIKKAVFEVAIHIPTGNEYAYVRLYNATDSQVVPFSELYYPGGSDQLFLISPSFKMAAGNKLYKVQMRTQLKYPAYLDQSRIHITL